MTASRDPQADAYLSNIVRVTSCAHMTDIAKTLRGDEAAERYLRERNLRVRCARYHFSQ
jgi:hypothetical protein